MGSARLGTASAAHAAPEPRSTTARNPAVADLLHGAGGPSDGFRHADFKIPLGAECRPPSRTAQMGPAQRSTASECHQ